MCGSLVLPEGGMKDVVVIGAGKIGATVAGLLASTGDYHMPATH